MSTPCSAQDPQPEIRCMSCGAVRDMYDLQPAVDRMWWVIPNRYVCRDAELCFLEVVKTARAVGAARRADKR